MARLGLLVASLFLLACQAEPICEPEAYPERGLRLLSPAEYEASILDLFDDLRDADCATDAQCEFATESCVGGGCVTDPCALHTFVLPDPGGSWSSAAVAGTFNGWAATAQEGALAMEHLPEAGAWIAKAALTDGTWQYKFVVDGGTWIEDPANPQTTPDGFGGNNSVVVQDCDGAAPPADPGFQPGQDLVPAVRPEGYPWDNHANGLVTSVHVEQFLAAGAGVAARVEPPAGSVRAWVEELGPRAWRRPLSAEEVDRLSALADPAVIVQVLLSSPGFLYRSEVGRPTQDGHFRLDPHETATALSYFLWGTTPDAALLAAADSDALQTPDQLEEQARRMLEDPRAHDQAARFVRQWLGVEHLLTIDKSPSLYPAMDGALRRAMLDETRAFVVDTMFEGGGTYADLLTGDSAGLAAGPLADLYADDEDPRAGLLGQAAFLAAHAHSDQSSPIRRGLFVRRDLLCHYLPPPPADAGGVPEVDPNATTQERFEQHTSDPACGGCHQYIDSIGFGLERFDAIGGWRDTENGHPIPEGGSVTDLEQPGDGTDDPFGSLPELGALLASSEAATACWSTQWGRYAVGRIEGSADSCSEARLVQEWAATGYRLDELLIGVVRSPFFVIRSAP